VPSGAELEIILWLAVAVLTGLGELLTGSFVLLPFTLGALAAAAVAAVGGGLALVLPVFLVVSVLSLFWLRRFASRFSAAAADIRAGAGRYVDAVGVATTDVSRLAPGRVRIDGESWRAICDSDTTIPTGGRVRVTEVRGNALVVVPD
jgi:membrane protein implicated in regulation of membrane protease activity